MELRLELRERCNSAINDVSSMLIDLPIRDVPFPASEVSKVIHLVAEPQVALTEEEHTKWGD